MTWADGSFYKGTFKMGEFDIGTFKNKKGGRSTLKGGNVISTGPKMPAGPASDR